MSLTRRSALPGLGGLAVLGAGCMTKPPRPAKADGTECMGAWRSRCRLDAGMGAGRA